MNELREARCETATQAAADRCRTGKAAQRLGARSPGCCDPDATASVCKLYDVDERRKLPDEAVLASLRLRQPRGAGRAARGRDGA